VKMTIFTSKWETSSATYLINAKASCVPFLTHRQSKGATLMRNERS
jgi:hypothetical protein